MLAFGLERGPDARSGGVLSVPVLQIGQNGLEIGDVDIAAAEIAEIVAMRLFLDIADAVAGVLDSTEFLPCDSLENILLADSRAREKVHEMFGC